MRRRTTERQSLLVILSAVTALALAVLASPSGAQTAAPDTPTNLSATAGDSEVALGWRVVEASNLAGYNVYRSTSLPVFPGGSRLNGATPVTTSAYTDTAVVNDTEYHYVVTAVDMAGNESAPSETVSATPQAAAPTVNEKINFQSKGTPVPSGYLRDFGEPFGVRTLANQGSGLSYGWVVPGTGTPLDLVGNGRDRNRAGIEQRLDTLMHMQGNDVPNFAGIPSKGAWEFAVPNGTYRVSVSVGDQPSGGTTYDSSHTINVEGSTIIDRFVGTAAEEYQRVTKIARVLDGRLTLDAEGGFNTKPNFVEVVSYDAAAHRPSVTGVVPANGETGVPRDTGVTATVHLPNVGGNIDETSLSEQTVKLYRASDSNPVPININTSGGGDVIVAQPTAPLEAETRYRFEVTGGLTDTTGAPFLPFASTFTTGTAGGGDPGGTVAFDKVQLPTASGKSFTSVAIGPDDRLYAGTIEGEILRFSLNPDGTTGTPQVINSIPAANGGAPRMLIGLAFDPASTASNPVLWVSHSTFAFNEAPDWGGKISRLSGPNLGTVQDYIVNLPRSYKDHLTNSIAFGPDGFIYVNQGSNTAMGAPDNAWGQRNEHLLNAAVLRINPDAITSPPLDVKTEEGGDYDPFAAGAPLRIYASGVRNAYDLVWHTNGELYVPTNGSAAGGSTPATPSPLPPACQQRIDAATSGDYTGPQVPGISSLPETQGDYLFRVRAGGYYGHPNPSRCEWVLNGGNPTAAADPEEVDQYPVGTQPDRNWRGAAFAFGNNKSPNGVIEYRSNSFGGALKGRLLVTRYSLADDVIVLEPGGANLDIIDSQKGLPGLTGFDDPLDLVEDRATGNLYVTEFGAQKITLLTPRPPAPPGTPTLDLDELSDTGISDTDDVTKDATPTIVGTAEANSTVRLYDGGILLKTTQANASGGWSITSSTLSSGVHTFTADATDANGGTSALSVELRVVLDTVAPTTQAPKGGLIAGSQLGTVNVPVTLDWSGSDSGGAGVYKYQLQQSIDGAAYASVPLPSGAATQLTRVVEPGRNHSFRVRAQDTAGNWGTYAVGPVISVIATQETDTGVTYQGTWLPLSTSGAYGGSVVYTASAGAKARFSFDGNEVAWISPEGSGRGLAEVWVDGVRETTVDLYSTSGQTRKVVFKKGWTISGRHEIEIRVLGAKSAASTGKRVDVDAFIVLRRE